MPHLEQTADLGIFYQVDNHSDPWINPETIIFIHGFTENVAAWYAWVPHFSRKYQVVRYDQRGFGQSLPTKGPLEFTTPHLITDLQNVIDRVSPHQKVHLVTGKSGAMTGIEIARTLPQKIQSLCMVSPAIKAPNIDGWVEHMQEFGMVSWARWTMGDRLGSKMPTKGLEWWINLMGQTPTKTAIAYLNWVASINQEPHLKELTMPTLIVGNDTARRGFAEFNRYVQQIPNSQLEMIQADGYHTGAVAPDACAAVVKAFIAKHPLDSL